MIKLVLGIIIRIVLGVFIGIILLSTLASLIKNILHVNDSIFIVVFFLSGVSIFAYVVYFALKYAKNKINFVNKNK